jgi:hypothetical protein
MIGTGLKKCMPITRSGSAKGAAMPPMDNDEVFDAKIVCAGARLGLQAQEELLLELDALGDRLDQQIRALGGLLQRGSRR